MRQQWNEYRLGADVDLAGFRFVVTHRWDYFKDDRRSVRPAWWRPGTAPARSCSTSFSARQPIHGASPGWFGNLFTRRKKFGINARMTYVSGNRDFA